MTLAWVAMLPLAVGPIARAQETAPPSEQTKLARVEYRSAFSLELPSEFKVVKGPSFEHWHARVLSANVDMDVYLGRDHVRSVPGGTGVRNRRAIKVDGRSAWVERWSRRPPLIAGKPEELQILVTINPELSLSVHASCSDSAACEAAMTIAESIRVLRREASHDVRRDVGRFSM